MSTQINLIAQNKTARPVVAGVFNIVIGSFCVLGAIAIGTGALLFIHATGNTFGIMPAGAGVISLLICLPLIALGTLSIAGGICEVQRRMWGLALLGSIAAARISTVLGIVSIVLTAVSKNEFAQQ
jgi:hypothetical protein